ncbi:hypothetical protein DPMN_113116 [Dreissena polymorpha]|uniref:Uncharacterized protein n=1 Tax=Dreissena polymorpha TaxID=45954 RepID=A0A9D4QQN5_DREPO|nr:hypothetical protein DPMN_113116 [Dreissena polymorpha]
MLDLKSCGANMKSLWLFAIPFGTCRVAVLDGWCGCDMSASVSWWLLTYSRSIISQPLVSPMPNLPTSPVLVCVWSNLSVPVTLDDIDFHSSEALLQHDLTLYKTVQAPRFCSA